MTRRTRRLFNVGLVGATVSIAAVGVLAVTVFVAQRDSLTDSQLEGSDPLVALSTARILALRSLSFANLDLIERGTVPAYGEDFEAAAQDVGRRLRAAAEQAADPAAGGRIAAIAERYDTFLAVHDEVQQLGAAGSYADADSLAVTEQADAAEAVDGALADEIDIARDRLDDNAERARGQLRWLPLAAAILAATAAVLAIVGLQLRLREYR